MGFEIYHFLYKHNIKLIAMFVCVWCRGWPPQRRLAFIVLIIYLWCWWLIHNKGILLYQHWSFFTFKYQPWFNFDDFLGLWHVYLSDFYRRINHQFRSGLMEFVGLCHFLWPICLPCNLPYLPKPLPISMIGRIPLIVMSLRWGIEHRE